MGFVAFAGTKLVAVSCSYCGVIQIVAAEVNVASRTSIIARTVVSLVSYKIGFCKSICRAIIDCGVGGCIG